MKDFEYTRDNSEGTTKVKGCEVLDIGRILKLDIADLAPVYGGVRGRTLSSPRQRFAWPEIKDAGIATIIDLRKDGIHTKMPQLCNQYGLEYFHYPVDTKAEHIAEMVDKFPELCQSIDAGNFYIACAMGLHRTDIVLCCYWMFYGADKQLSPPEIRGYRQATGHEINKIMRVINAFYNHLSEKKGTPPFSHDSFHERKKIILEQAKR